MSRLTCQQCENMLLDAADGVLLTEDETHFRLHMAGCPACTRLYSDLTRGSAWMDMLKAVPPVPPEDMVDRILAATSGDQVVHHEVMAGIAHAQSLLGHGQGAKVLPFRTPQPRTAWARAMHTVMQPRFAMTAAMAFFSIALTLNLAGVKLSGLRASDLSPRSVKKSFWAANGRVVQYYDNLRVVYELESRLHEMQRDSDSDPATRRGILTKPDPDDTEQPARQPGGQPRSSAPVFRQGGHDGELSLRGHQQLHLLPVEHLVERSIAQVLRGQQAVSGEGVQA